MNREAITGALFTLLQNSPGFLLYSRRFALWNTITTQPALILRVADDDYFPHKTYGGPPKVCMNFEVWIYSQVGKSPEAIPSASLNNLIDAVEGVITPSYPGAVQTLGGLVNHCWIEGKVIKDSGDLDDQAKAKIPIKALVG